MDSPSSDESLDFATLLEQSFEENVTDVRRGDLLKGIILAIDDDGIILDVGLKRDGVCPRHDIEETDLVPDSLEVGQEVNVLVARVEDRDGNLIVSIKQARANIDWDRAQKIMDADQCYQGRIIAANKGGLIVPFGELRGFVPASHVVDMPRNLDEEERIAYLRQHIGQILDLKIIEVNPRRRRLVLSQRMAYREQREETKEILIEELNVGDVVDGTVSSLRDFGAFVDIGGADGLIHVSELAWYRIGHPSEVVKPGDRIRTMIIQLDDEDMRIGLSLKRLKPNPWEDLAEKIEIGDTVTGVVSRVVSFGAFVELPNGIEALLHISELTDPQPDYVEQVVTTGQRLVACVISLEPDRQRMGLSIKDIQDPFPDRIEDDQPLTEPDPG